MGTLLTSVARFFVDPPAAGPTAPSPPGESDPNSANNPDFRSSWDQKSGLVCENGGNEASRVAQRVRWLAPAPTAPPIPAALAANAPGTTQDPAFLAANAPDTTRAPSPRAGAPPLHLATICTPRDLRLAAGATALAAAHIARATSALIAEWTGEEPQQPPDRACSPTARRTALALRADGHAAQAAGRLVRIALPADEHKAVDTARTVLPLFGTFGPTVVAIAGPRGTAVGRLLAEQDLALLIRRPGGDAELDMLTELGLYTDGARVRTLELAASPAASLLARSGTGLVAPLRAPFLAAIGGRP